MTIAEWRPVGVVQLEAEAIRTRLLRVTPGLWI